MINSFFKEYKDLEYSEFLNLYHEEFGYFLEEATRIRNANALSTIKTAAVIYIISVIVGILTGIAFFAGGFLKILMVY